MRGSLEVETAGRSQALCGSRLAKFSGVRKELVEPSAEHSDVLVGLISSAWAVSKLG
jgi:hypothetical protein